MELSSLIWDQRSSQSQSSQSLKQDWDWPRASRPSPRGPQKGVFVPGPMGAPALRF